MGVYNKTKKSNRKQIYYNRSRLIEKFSFLSKMKKLWDRLYYSNFVDRIVNIPFGFEKHLYFDVKLNKNTNININEFLLFNKFWNRYTEISQNTLPLWNFGAFDRDLLSLKCSWEYKNFYGIPSYTNVIKFDNFLIKSLSAPSSIIWMGIRIHLFIYIMLILFCLFFCFILAYNNGFYNLYNEYFFFGLNFSYDNINLYLNNQKYFMKDDFLLPFSWYTDFILIQFGNGFWAITGNYFYFYNDYFFFFKNYVYFLIYFITEIYNYFFDSGFFFRINKMSYYVLSSMQKHIFWVILDLTTIPVFHALFWEWWAENSIYYIDDYFYTGGWRLIYNIVWFGFSSLRGIWFWIHWSIEHTTEIKQNILFYFYYPMLVYYYIYIYTAVIVKSLTTIIVQILFLDEIWNWFLNNLHKYYILKILFWFKQFFVVSFSWMWVKSAFIREYLSGEGFIFRYMWMDWIWEVVSTLFESFSFGQFIFERKLMVLLYYNWYVYVGFIWKAVLESSVAFFFDIPSVLYLYTTTFVGLFLKVIPFFIFENDFIFLPTPYTLFTQLLFDTLSRIVLHNYSFSFLNPILTYVDTTISLYISFLFLIFDKQDGVFWEKMFFLSPDFVPFWLYGVYEQMLFEKTITFSSSFIIEPFFKTFFFVKQIFFFFFFGLNLTQTAWNEWLINFFTTWQVFLFFEYDLYFHELINFLYWKQVFSSFFENRVVYIINETTYRKHLLDLYFFIFKEYYPHQYMLYTTKDNLNFSAFPEFFLDVYWELWDSINFQKDLLFINPRRIDLNFLTGAYNIIREFGYTLPIHHQRLGALVNLYQEIVHETTLIDFLKEPAPEIYEDWTRMYGGPLHIDLYLILEIWLAISIHYLVDYFEEEGFLDDIIFYYSDAWLLDPARKDFDKLVARVVNESFIHGFSSTPFSKLATNLWLLDASLHFSKESVLFTRFSFSSFIILDSYEDFWRYIWFYGGKDFIFSKFWVDVIPFSSFFYNILVVWRKFYWYGTGLPVGSVDVVFLLDVLFPLYNIILNVYLYFLFLINLCYFLIQTFSSNDFSSFIGLYLIYFSEFKSPLLSNINISIFFELFNFFYSVSLWVKNTLIFWLTEAYVSTSILKWPSVYQEFSGWISFDFNPFAIYQEYFKENMYIRFLNNLMLDEIFSSFGFFDYYLNFQNLTIISEIQSKPINIYGINSLYQWEFGSKIDKTFVNNFLFLEDIDAFYFNYLIKFIIDSCVFLAEPLLKLSAYDNIKREESLMNFAYFNLLVELRFSHEHNLVVDLPGSFPILFREFVLDNIFFEFLDEIVQANLYDYKNQSQRFFVTKDDFLKYAATSWYEKLLKAYTIRNKGLCGFWDALDIIIFIASCCFILFFLVLSYYFIFFTTTLWDVWEQYLIVLYPRLAKNKRKFFRDADSFVYDEEGADAMFEYGSYFFQSSDYVFLPYRHFTFESFLKRPSWLYSDEYVFDLSLNFFLTNKIKWDAADLSRKLVFSKDKTQGFFYFRKYGVIPEYKDKKIFPMFDFWFKDKKSLYWSNIVSSNKYMYYYIVLFLSVFIVDYSGDLLKYWGFKWFFFIPHTFLDFFWSTKVLMIHPFFFDRLFSITGFLIFLVIIFLSYFVFCWIQYYIYESTLLIGSISFYNNILVFLLIMNVLGSGRFWEQRTLSFDFLAEGKNNFFWNMLYKKKTLFESSDLYFKNGCNHNSSYGWSSILNDSICLNSMVENSFFLEDLSTIHLSSLIEYNGVDKNTTLYSFYNLQTILNSNLVVFKKNNISNVDLDTVDIKGLTTEFLWEDLMSNKWNLNEVYFYFDNTSILKNLVDLKLFNSNNTSSFLYGSNFVFFDFVTYLPEKQNQKIHAHFLKHQLNYTSFVPLGNLSVGLLEESWNFGNYLKNFRNVSKAPGNNLYQNDIKKYLESNKSFFNFNFKKPDWNYILKIPILESHIPDPQHKPDWSFGEYVPTMADYLKYKWDMTGTFFGVADNNLAYRELLDRSANFVGIEQAWGFVDVHDYYDTTSEAADFFRTEFYNQLLEEKKNRLKFKESWIDFDINISSNHPSFNTQTSFQYESEAQFFRSFFFDNNIDQTMLATMTDYPLMKNIYLNTRTFPDDYDIESVFHLSYRFDYENLKK